MAKADTTPSAARSYPTVATWIQNEANRARANEILKDPVYLAMMHYAKEASRPRAKDLTGPEALLDAEIIRKASIHAGVCQITDIFRKLLTPQTPGVEVKGSWEHIELPNE